MKRLLSLTLMAYVLSSCGGGGGGNNSSSLKSGVFVDAPVANAEYEVRVDGKLVSTGITDENGVFLYPSSASNKAVVTFKSEDIVIGSTNLNTVITPMNFANSTVDGIAIAALIQNADEDNKTGNGIKISKKKLKNLLGNSYNNVQKNISKVKSKLKDKLDNAAAHFAEYNLFGEYQTNPPIEWPSGKIATNNTLTCDNTQYKVFSKFLFNGVKGGGIIEWLNTSENKVKFEFYRFSITDYSIGQNQIKVRLIGTNLANGRELPIELKFAPEENQKVQLTIPGICTGSVTLSRTAYPKPSDCRNSKIDLTQELENDTALVKCHPNNAEGEISLSEICTYNETEEENGTIATYFDDSHPIDNSYNETCDIKLQDLDNSEGDEVIVGLVLSENKFSILWNDKTENNEISPNFFDCTYNDTTKTTECSNYYINVDNTGQVTEFVIEKVKFHKKPTK